MGGFSIVSALFNGCSSDISKLVSSLCLLIVDAVCTTIPISLGVIELLEALFASSTILLALSILSQLIYYSRVFFTILMTSKLFWSNEM